MKIRHHECKVSKHWNGFVAHCKKHPDMGLDVIKTIQMPILEDIGLINSIDNTCHNDNCHQIHKSISDKDDKNKTKSQGQERFNKDGQSNKR